MYLTPSGLHPGIALGKSPKAEPQNETPQTSAALANGVAVRRQR